MLEIRLLETYLGNPVVSTFGENDTYEMSRGETKYTMFTPLVQE